MELIFLASCQNVLTAWLGKTLGCSHFVFYSPTAAPGSWGKGGGDGAWWSQGGDLGGWRVKRDSASATNPSGMVRDTGLPLLPLLSFPGSSFLEQNHQSQLIPCIHLLSRFNFPVHGSWSDVSSPLLFSGQESREQQGRGPGAGKAPPLRLRRHTVARGQTAVIRGAGANSAAPSQCSSPELCFPSLPLYTGKASREQEALSAGTAPRNHDKPQQSTSHVPQTKFS